MFVRDCDNTPVYLVVYLCPRQSAVRNVAHQPRNRNVHAACEHQIVNEAYLPDINKLHITCTQASSGYWVVVFVILRQSYRLLHKTVSHFVQISFSTRLSHTTSHDDTPHKTAVVKQVTHDSWLRRKNTVDNCGCKQLVEKIFTLLNSSVSMPCED